MTALSAERVEAVLRDCLFRDGEPTDGRVQVEGIVTTFGFHPGRLAEHRDEIFRMLHELPRAFMETGGGGMSFLNACMDRHGDQWTGEHRTVDMLVVLGIATGWVDYCLPREMWEVLPGGMPYFVVHDKTEED